MKGKDPPGNQVMPIFCRCEIQGGEGSQCQSVGAIQWQEGAAKIVNPIHLSLFCKLHMISGNWFLT